MHFWTHTAYVHECRVDQHVHRPACSSTSMFMRESVSSMRPSSVAVSETLCFPRPPLTLKTKLIGRWCAPFRIGPQNRSSVSVLPPARRRRFCGWRPTTAERRRRNMPTILTPRSAVPRRCFCTLVLRSWTGQVLQGTPRSTCPRMEYRWRTCPKNAVQASRLTSLCLGTVCCAAGARHL